MQELARVIERAERDRSIAPSSRPQAGVCAPVSDEELAQRVETIIHQWPSQFFSRRCLTECASEFYEAKVVRCDSSAIVHEPHSLLPLPFPVAQVGEALWATCQLDHATTADETYSQTHRVLDDWVFAQFTTTLRGDALIKGRFVTKRIVIDAEQTFVARAYSEPNGLPPQLDGVCIFEDSWARVVDVSLLVAVSDLPTPVALVQLVRRTQMCFPTTQGLSLASMEPLSSEQIITFVESHFQGDVEWMRQELEDSLLRSRTIQ